MTEETKQGSQITILRETVLESWLKDYGSLGALVAALLASEYLIGGSWVVDIVVLVGFVVWIGGRISRAKGKVKSMTLDQMKEWIKTQ